jgi:hypothetical protein
MMLKIFQTLLKDHSLRGLGKEFSHRFYALHRVACMIETLIDAKGIFGGSEQRGVIIGC